MDHKEFQALAVRTESIVDETKLSPTDATIFRAALDAFNHSVEILDIYKKHMFYGREVNYDTVHHHSFKGSRALGHVNFCIEGGDSLVFNDPSDVTLPGNPRVFHALLGSITEHGEIGTALAEFLKTGELDLVNVCEELGDSDWYKALFFEATGIDWDTVQSMIIKKLEIRYPEKVFGVGAAIDRDLEAERALLESVILEAVEAYNAKEQ